MISLEKSLEWRVWVYYAEKLGCVGVKSCKNDGTCLVAGTWGSSQDLHFGIFTTPKSDDSHHSRSEDISSPGIQSYTAAQSWLDSESRIPITW